MLTTPFLLRLRSYRRFSRMYNTRVRFACPIYFSRAQSSSKLIIFLDSKLERSNSRVAKIDSRLDSRNFRGSRIESRVELRNSRVTVNLPLSGTVSVDCRSTYQPTLGRCVDRDVSVDMSGAMLTDTSRSIYRPSVGRHVDR